MTKVYGVYGRTTVEINIPVGKAVLPIEFTKGNLDRKNYRPATYSTDSETLQNMIESSPLFGGLIKIYRTYGEEKKEAPKAAAPVKAPVAEAAPKKAAAPVEAPAVTEYPEVTSLDDVVRTLKSLGVKATSLRDENAIKKAIQARGLSFPNFNF